MFLGNPLVAGLFALAVSGRAMQGYALAPVLHALGQQRSLSIPIATLLPPYHPLYLCLQYIFQQHDAFFKPQNLWTWNAGRSLALYLNWTVRSLYDITSTRVSSSSKYWLLIRFVPYDSVWYSRWTDVGVLVIFWIFVLFHKNIQILYTSYKIIR